jgi:hypothetical protein
MKDANYIGEFWQQRINEAEEERARQFEEAMSRWRQQNPVLSFIAGVETGLGTWVNNAITKPLLNVANAILSNIPGIGQLYDKLGIKKFLTEGVKNFDKYLEDEARTIADPTTNIVTQMGAEVLSSLSAPVSKGLQALKVASDVTDMAKSSPSGLRQMTGLQGLGVKQTQYAQRIQMALAQARSRAS